MDTFKLNVYGGSQTGNGRIYKAEDFINSPTKDAIQNNSLFVYVSAPGLVNPSLCNLSGVVKDIRLEDDNIIVDVVWKNTPSGMHIQNLREQFWDRFYDIIGLSPVGIGYVSPEGIVTDYRLLFLEASMLPVGQKPI